MRSILDYGAAVGKSAIENKAAIQMAIDAAFDAGGDIVQVPAGTFVTGNLRLKSNVVLRLEQGAVLMGSSDYRDYDFTSTPVGWSSMVAVNGTDIEKNMIGFLWAENAENIGIEGSGIVDGQGGNHIYFPHPDDPFKRRPMLVLFINCKNIRISDITMRNPAMFNLLAVMSKRIWVKGVFVDSLETENGDGLDFDGCEDVMISDCLLEAGDDAISLKCTHPGWACRNYTITNCILRSVWAGFRMGTESSADMTEIVLSNCVFENCNDGLKIQDCAGGVYDNVRISNCVMRNVHRPIYMTANSYRLCRYDPSIRPKLGGIRNIVIDGLTAYMSHGGEDYQRNCFVVTGTTKDVLRDITFRDVKVYFDGGGTEALAERTDIQEYLDYSFIYADIFCINGKFPAAGPFLRHIDGLRMENCEFILDSPDARPMFYAADVKNALLQDVRVRGETPLALRYVDSKIEQRLCGMNDSDFKAEALSDELLERYRKGATDTAVTDAQFAGWALTVDSAERCPVKTVLDSWKKEGNCWSASFDGTGVKLVLFRLYGNMDLYLNGEKIDSCRISRAYRNVIEWACDLSGKLKDGENSIEIRWDDMEDTGGIDSLLPFGEFRPFHVGFHRQVLLCGE